MKQRPTGQLKSHRHQAWSQINDHRNYDGSDNPDNRRASEDAPIERPQPDEATLENGDYDRRRMWREDGNQIEIQSSASKVRVVQRKQCNPRRPTDEVSDEKERRDRTPFLQRYDVHRVARRASAP